MEEDRGQASFRYMVNYGWAVLVVIIVIAVLWGLGMFTDAAPVACRPCFTYFSYTDYSGGILVLRNGAEEIDIDSVTGGSLGGRYAAGEQFRVTGIRTSGDVAVEITYTVSRSGLQHTDRATIHN